MSEEYYNIQGLPSDLLNTKEIGVRSVKVSLHDGGNNGLISNDGHLVINGNMQLVSLLECLLIQSRIQTEIMRLAFDIDLKEEDLE